MKLTAPLACLALPALVACASPSTPDGAPVVSQAAPAAVTPHAAGPAADPAESADPTAAPGQPAALAAGAAATTAPADHTPPGLAEQRGHLSEAELAIWNSDRFRRLFTLSYQAATDIEPRLTEDEVALMQDVLELMGEDDLDQALQILGEENSAGASAVLDFTIGSIHFQRDEMDLAVDALESAVQKFPNFRRGWQNLGVAYFRLANYEAALRPLTRYLELGGGESTLYGMLGFSYFHLDNSLSAESAFRRAVLLDPYTLDWKKGLVFSLLKQSRYAEAVALSGSMIADAPSRPELWALQAHAYMGLERYLQAAENFEMVERLGGSSYDSLVNLGDIYTNEGIDDLAVDAHLRALERFPDEGLERSLRAAQLLARRGAHDEVERLARGIETGAGPRLTDSDRTELLRLRAQVALARGADDEQAAILEEVIRIDPLDGQALILLGRHRTAKGQVEEAIYYYERAADLDDFVVDAKIAHGQLLVGQGRHDEAVPLLKKALQLEHRDNVADYLAAVQSLARR